jgi:hypothetical protein
LLLVLTHFHIHLSAVLKNDVLQEIIFKSNKSVPIIQHRKTVLEEIVRQKTQNDYYNAAKLSVIAESSAAPQREQAMSLGRLDELETIRIWSPPGLIRAASEPFKKAVPIVKESKRKSFFGFLKKK